MVLGFGMPLLYRSGLGQLFHVPGLHSLRSLKVATPQTKTMRTVCINTCTVGAPDLWAALILGAGQAV